MPIANAESFTGATVSEYSGRRTGRPRVSVVFNSADSENDATLHERSTRWKQLEIETVIVSTEYFGRPARTFTDARVVYAPADSTLAQRRALGLTAASGDLVIMMDASQRPDDAWIARLAGLAPSASVQASR